MNTVNAITSVMCCAVLAALITGCEPDGADDTTPSSNRISETTPAPPPGTSAAAVRRTETSTAPATQPTGAPPRTSGAQIESGTLRLTGIALTVPEGWMAQPVAPGSMVAKAVFEIPRDDDGGEPGSVRITHFPSMKGKDDMNIDRWLAQTTRPDGTPMPREDARIEHEDVGGIHLTIVDVSGNVKATMRGTAQPGGRMIAAIVDHPQGPHFIVATGEAALIAKWEEKIREFLHSARVE